MDTPTRTRSIRRRAGGASIESRQPHFFQGLFPPTGNEAPPRHETVLGLDSIILTPRDLTAMLEPAMSDAIVGFVVDGIEHCTLIGEECAEPFRPIDGTDCVVVCSVQMDLSPA